MRISSGLVVSIVSCVVLVGSCSRGKPGNVVVTYLKAAGRLDTVAAYGLLSTEDRGVKTFEQYKEMTSNTGLLDAIHEIAKRTTYNVKAEKIQGDRADVVVATTGPDVEKAGGTLLRALFAAALGGEKSKAVADEEIAKVIRSSDLPLVTKEETYHLVRENGEWKVYLGMAKEEEEQRHRLEMEELKGEIDRLVEKKQFDAAVEAFERMAKLEPSSPLVSETKTRLTTEIGIYQEQSAYFSKLEIRGLKLDPASSTTGVDSSAFISGEIKNNGDRTVTQVRALLLLLDAEGRPCHEYNFSPVITVEGEDRFGPLRPNYSLSFLVEIKDPPSTWDGRTYRIKWISLEFE